MTHKNTDKLKPLYPPSHTLTDSPSTLHTLTDSFQQQIGTYSLPLIPCARALTLTQSSREHLMTPAPTSTTDSSHLCPTSSCQLEGFQTAQSALLHPFSLLTRCSGSPGFPPSYCVRGSSHLEFLVIFVATRWTCWSLPFRKRKRRAVSLAGHHTFCVTSTCRNVSSFAIRFFIGIPSTIPTNFIYLG